FAPARVIDLPDGDVGVRITDTKPDLRGARPCRAIGEAGRGGIALAGGNSLVPEGCDHYVGRGRAIEILLIADLAHCEQDQHDGDEPHDATPFRHAHERMPAAGESAATVNKRLRRVAG